MKKSGPLVGRGPATRPGAGRCGRGVVEVWVLVICHEVENRPLRRARGKAACERHLAAGHLPHCEADGLVPGVDAPGYIDAIRAEVEVSDAEQGGRGGSIQAA